MLSIPNEAINDQEYRSLLKLENRHVYGFNLGRAIKAISLSSNDLFLESLQSILRAHAGMAKHGALRESAEGLICLSAMSLGLVALNRGMSLNIENEYFSMSYLNYLLEK